MLSGMQQLSFPTRQTRPIGWSGAAAVIAGAAMGRHRRRQDRLPSQRLAQ
jgi:hypothetical protein